MKPEQLRATLDRAAVDWVDEAVRQVHADPGGGR